MKAGQIREIVERHRKLAELVLTIHPEVVNVQCGDSMMTYDKIMSFRHDARLLAAIDAALDSMKEEDQMLYRGVLWRTHGLIWAARHCLHIEGDFVEFGVYQGYSACVIANYLDFDKVPKQWWLFDTFEGMPPELENKLSRNGYLLDRYKDPTLLDFVETRFARFPNVRVVKGFIPQVLEEQCPERIALLHIDMNSATAERDGLAAVFDRVSPGGVIVFDDYGRVNYRENHDLLKAFLLERGHFALELPTGQGMVIKH